LQLEALRFPKAKPVYPTTQNGYVAIYKHFQSATKITNKGLRVGCLLKPFKVLEMRQMLNLKLSKYIGDYYCLIKSNTFLPTTKSKAWLKDKEPINIYFDQYNNIFADIE